ncbi:sugar transferase, partial [Ignavibacterium album]|uniref:sugar transferase n=1 Tax=Ignavibacterium album TaxID=591197 RepID=UPI0038B2CF5F
MNNLAPIALFVYARPDETAKTIESLSKNFLASESDLYIFSDGPKGEKDFKKVSEVRALIKSINSGFKKIKIIEREKNLGLANSIITGVSEILSENDRIIVMEEDLISSENFLNFVNDSLDKYEKDEKVFSVTGYTYHINIPENYKYDNYFTPRCESLGWGTWKDRWMKADWELKEFKDFIKDKNAIKNFNKVGCDLIGMLIKQQLGKLDSWAVRWCFTHFKNNAVCSYPTSSKIIHIGEGGFATHVKRQNKLLDTKLDFENKKDFVLAKEVFFEKEIAKQYQKFFKQNLIKKIKTKLLL